MKWSFSAPGGPGGQHANKTASKAMLTVSVDLLEVGPGTAENLRRAYGDYVRVWSSKSRSQAENRTECLRKIGERLDRAALEKTTRMPGGPGPAAKARRVADKRRRGAIKQLRRETGELE